MNIIISRPRISANRALREIRDLRVPGAVLLGLFIAAMAVLQAPPARAADAARGRALYENHCQHCHTSKIHSRVNRLPMTKNELRTIVDDMRRQIDLPWTPDETEDVLDFLNRTRYQFPGN
jgi:hypothetical protein